MTNNEILRRIKVTFGFTPTQLLELVQSAEHPLEMEQLRLWLHKGNDDEIEMPDVALAAILNGFINLKRGKREGEQPAPEEKLNNNIIFRKLKIALNFKDTDILDVLKIADFRFGKAELSALFRKPGHSHYRHCKDQVLRNFMNGLYTKYKGK